MKVRLPVPVPVLHTPRPTLHTPLQPRTVCLGSRLLTLMNDPRLLLNGLGFRPGLGLANRRVPAYLNHFPSHAFFPFFHVREPPSIEPRDFVEECCETTTDTKVEDLEGD